MKTDLRKILAVTGESGLFNYVSQVRLGAILESLSTKQRNKFGLSAKMTSLADISIYTDEGETKLQDVFEAMHKELGENEAPSPKSEPNVIKDFFAKVLPTYDRDRFYVSHMKKVLAWYNELLKHASLDFVTEEEAAETEADAPAEEAE